MSRRRKTAKVLFSDGLVMRVRSARNLVFGRDRLAVPEERWAPGDIEFDDGELGEFCELHGDDAARCRAFEARQA